MEKSHLLGETKHRLYHAGISSARPLITSRPPGWSIVYVLELIMLSYCLIRNENGRMTWKNGRFQVYGYLFAVHL